MSMYELVKSIKTDVNDILVDVVGGGDSRLNVSPTGNFFYMKVGGEQRNFDEGDGDIVPGLADVNDPIALGNIVVPPFTAPSYLISQPGADYAGQDGAHSLYAYVINSNQSSGYTIDVLNLAAQSNALNGIYCVFKCMVASVNNASNPYNLQPIIWQNANDLLNYNVQFGTMPTNTSVMNLAGIPLPPEGRILLDKLEYGNFGADACDVNIFHLVFQEVAGVMTQVLRYKIFHIEMDTTMSSMVSVDLSDTPPIIAESLQPTSAYKHLICVSFNGGGAPASNAGNACAYLSATIQINSTLN